jgi:hypothetical protein
MEIAEKKHFFYTCTFCDYSTSHKTGYDRHILTQKHLKVLNSENVAEKKHLDYTCSVCDFNTRHKPDYDRHLLTQKHLRLANPEKIIKKERMSYNCDCCKYETYRKTDYDKHILTQKHIDKTIENEKYEEKDEMKERGIGPDMNLTALVIELIKDNKELRNSMLELAKNQAIANSTVTTNSHNNNNTNNNQFNLNFFLNETCKDAMNIDDFVKTLQVTMEDFETTGRLGYVEGITRIILNGLKQVDTTKRPIHCTDLKRETVYIKHEDSWEKENQEKEKLKSAVSRVARMNLSQLPKWQKENPESEVLDTKEHGEYMKFAKAALGGMGDKEEQRYVDKIMKNVMKEVTVSKSGEH